MGGRTRSGSEDEVRSVPHVKSAHMHENVTIYKSCLPTVILNKCNPCNMSFYHNIKGIMVNEYGDLNHKHFASLLEFYFLYIK